MDPATIIAAGVAAYLLLGRKQTGAETPAPPDRPQTDDRDLGYGLELPTQQARDSRQIADGQAVPVGQYVDGQTIEVNQPVPYGVFFSGRSNWSRWAPMASGSQAPVWGAAGMPVRATNPIAPGDAAVPLDAETRVIYSYISDYPSAKYPRRRFAGAGGRETPGGSAAIANSKWSGVAVIGDEPRWLPINPELHREYTENPAGMPDAPVTGPQRGQGRVRRLRGIRTAEGLPMVLAADSVNWSSITARNDAQGEYRLFVGYNAWTVVNVAGDAPVSLSRIDAERKLAWVVPGRLDAVEAGRHTDENVRSMIVDEDGRPGGNVWDMRYYRALKRLTARGDRPLNLNRDRLIPALNMTYPHGDSFAYLSGWREFTPTAQNVVRASMAHVCMSTTDQWDISRPFSFGRRCTSSMTMATPPMMGKFNARAVVNQDVGYVQGGPMAWARGTASQYQSSTPRIPFALEAALLLKTLRNRPYVRVFGEQQR